MPSDQDTRRQVAWDHIFWCADQAAEVWRAYRSSDDRPQQFIACCRESAFVPADRDVRHRVYEALDAMNTALVEATQTFLPAHAQLAIEYAVTAITSIASTAPTGSIMRDVRVFTAHARAHHAAHRFAGQAPAEIVRVETDTLELVQMEQDADLLRRLRERGVER